MSPQNPMSHAVHVTLAYDEEARVWYIEDSTLPGLSGEAETVDDLLRRIPAMVVDLVEENGIDDMHGDFEVPLEIATKTRVQIHEAA